MADKQAFDDFMASIKDQLEKDGFEITDNDALKDAYEASEKGLSLDEVKKFAKKKEDENEQQGNEENPTEPEKDKDGRTIIGEELPKEKSEKNNEHQDEEWKTKLSEEWKKWAAENNQIYEDFIDPDRQSNLSFHLYTSEEQKEKGVFESEISYASPQEMSVKGYEGATPSIAIFTKILEEAKKNGPNIEFGANLKPEFAANLYIACLQDPGVKVLNPPSQEEMDKWPKSLKEAVAQAIAEAEKSNPQPQKQEEKPKEEPKQEEKPVEPKQTYMDAWNKVAAHKMDNKNQVFDLENITNTETKAMYFAAGALAGIKMQGNITSDEIKEITNPEIHKRLDEAKIFRQALDGIRDGVAKGTVPEIVLDNFKTPEKKALWMMAALEGGAKMVGSMTTDEIKALPEHLQVPLIRKQREAKIAELRKKGAQLNGGNADAFDKKRSEERDKRAESTISDIHKYEREVEMDADGKTPKKDEKTGHPIYKKNDKGEFIFKADDKGNKIETVGYQALKKRLAGYGRPK